MKWIVVVLLITLLALVPHTAAAHVLVTDETRSKGAIVHIIPDDDPVAGEKAVLYFDTQGGLLDDQASVSFMVSNSAGEVVHVSTKTDGSLVTAEYVFPIQGVYDLTFTVATSGKQYVFNQSQRVSRGMVGSALDKPSYAAAEIGVLASGIGIVLLLIVAFNHRAGLASHSSL